MENEDLYSKLKDTAFINEILSLSILNNSILKILLANHIENTSKNGEESKLEVYQNLEDDCKKSLNNILNRLKDDII